MELKIESSQASMGVKGLTDINEYESIKTIDNPRQRAEAVAEQFEKVFMGMMVKSMRATVPEGGLFGKGLGGQMYVQMLDDYYTQQSSNTFDPRFHQTLVESIMQSPDIVNEMQAAMNGEGQAKGAQAAAAAGKLD